jgi:hypothetical protein
MNIEIKNLRTARPTEPWQVRVDRASVLGNPFRMAHECERDEVCEAYFDYFHKRIASGDEAFCNELQRLISLAMQYDKLELFCWCAPKRCHAETIAEFIEMHLE